MSQTPDTPRCDALQLERLQWAANHPDDGTTGAKLDRVLTEPERWTQFARQLERELEAEKAEHERTRVYLHEVAMGDHDSLLRRERDALGARIAELEKQSAVSILWAECDSLRQQLQSHQQLFVEFLGLYGLLPNIENQYAERLPFHLRTEIERLRQQLDLHCRDWADDDSRVKEIAAKFGWKPPEHDAFPTVVDVAEWMGGQLEAMRKALDEIARDSQVEFKAIFLHQPTNTHELPT